MVRLATIQRCNKTFAAQQAPEAPVCVFVGATSGIGASTVEKLVRMFHAPTFYIIGRCKARFPGQNARLKLLNPDCKIIFLEAQFSLLSHVDAACKQIIATEKKVDYLYMSPGVIPLNGAQYTAEGLEVCFAISYYSRMRLVWNLLPLLCQSPRPRVLSVLNGGKEKPLIEQDLGLENSWSVSAVINHTTTMTTLAFHHLAENHPHVTFLHTYPGWVRTDNFSNIAIPESSSALWIMFLMLVKNVARILAILFGTSAAECGDRQAFHLTADFYHQGVRLVTHLSEEATENRTVRLYKEQLVPQKTWYHTMRAFNAASTWNTRLLPQL